MKMNISNTEVEEYQKIEERRKEGHVEMFLSSGAQSRNSGKRILLNFVLGNQL
jgi:hypothetical protein